MSTLPIFAPADYIPVSAEPGDIAARVAPVAGTMTASGASAAIAVQLARPAWLRLSGSWSGSVRVEASVDAGSSWQPLTTGYGEPVAYPRNAYEQLPFLPSEAGMALRLSVTLVSGTVAYRIAQ